MQAGCGDFSRSIRGGFSLCGVCKLEHKKLIDYLVLAAITGSVAIFASHIAKMSDNLQKITVSVQELNARIEILTTQMVRTDDIIRDHESRLRQLERVK